MSRIDEIRARLDAATRGPWYADNNTERLWVCQRGTGRPIADVADSDQSRNLIAHAPADIAWLLDEVERLRGEVERLQEVEKNRERLGAKLRDYMNSRDCNG